MVVIICDCYKNFPPFSYQCEKCIIEPLQQFLSNWTSGNEIIDKFIQKRQRANLEWIPYNRLGNVKYHGKKKSNTICSADRLDGQLSYDRKKRKWYRYNKLEVVLKSLNKSLNEEFLIKVMILILHI